MTDRSTASITRVSPQPGSGILHPFPTDALPHLDPFVFLDTGEPQQLGDREIYVGPHPHRGVQPVSLLFRGRIEHRDSLGKQRTVHSGGMQWLVAGRGAMHEERLHGDDDGVFHMAQLWINLPARLKLQPPEHHAATADQVPEFSLGTGTTVRLFAGTLGNAQGPAPMPTPVVVAHATLQPGATLRVPVPRGWNAGATVVAGEVQADGEPLSGGDTVVFADDGTHLSLSSDVGGQVLLMLGEPIGEPIAMGAGFVMNTPAEIDQAFADYRNGAMGSME